MAPNWPLIQAQMRDFPNLVVLSYGSVHVSKRPDIMGRICVHSRAGRIDPIFINEPGRGGGNAVDVEALQYGGKFKGPRIWVSDGYACGGNYDDGSWGEYTGKLPTMIRGIMLKDHYIRVADLEDALAYVTGARQVHYWTSGILEPTAASRTRGNPYDQTSRHHKYGRRIR
jgi:hypothetical protein